MMNAALCCALAAAALLVAALLRKRMVLRREPAGLDAPLPPSTRLGSVEDFLRARESAAAPIAPGAESSIIWAAGRRGEPREGGRGERGGRPMDRASREGGGRGERGSRSLPSRSRR